MFLRACHISHRSVLCFMFCKIPFSRRNLDYDRLFATEVQPKLRLPSINSIYPQLVHLNLCHVSLISLQDDHPFLNIIVLATSRLL